MTWKTVEAFALNIDKDNKLVKYGSIATAQKMDMDCKNAKKFYKTNLQKNIEKMDELCEKISEKIGKKCEYMVEGSKPNNTKFTISIDILFPKQEDWQLLEDLVPSVYLAEIEFPETYLQNYEDFYYIEEKNGTAMEAYGEPITILPHVEILKCDKVEVEDFYLTETDEEDEEEISSYVCKSSVGKYGKILDDYKDEKPFYPFSLEEIIGNFEILKTKKWEDKVIESVADSYKKLNEILTVVKPYALDRKNEIIKHKKMITCLKSKLRIIGE